MLLDLSRRAPRMTAILGVLQVDGLFNCYTEECTTVAIPTGSYSIELTYSPHFQRQMPLIDNVPGRSAVRIHPGNTVCDTEGCILVGTQHTDTTLIHSDAAFEPLLKSITTALAAGEKVTITIS